MGKIWFTGDTHFGHERTRELSKRPFSNVSEMDNAMMENWNAVVANDDYVIHVGDFGDYKVSNLLNGRIILLYGNYERNDIEKGIITDGSIRKNFNFFDVNTVNRKVISAGYGDERIMLDIVHEPTHRNVHNFTLFGHIHKLQMVKQNALNVGVDCHNFTPIDLDTVKFYKKAIEEFYDEDVFTL